MLKFYAKGRQWELCCDSANPDGVISDLVSFGVWKRIWPETVVEKEKAGEEYIEKMRRYTASMCTMGDSGLGSGRRVLV